MPGVPVPCTNCFRFHYGICYDSPRQCHNCGGYKHLSRYCPDRRRITRDRGEPLPGTRAWCEQYGLDNDPELKHGILDSIKTSPGDAIYVDGDCIYRGTQRHFHTGGPGRGRATYEYRGRRRSRSPPRDRGDQRSRSPLRRRDEFVRERSPPSMREMDSYRPGTLKLYDAPNLYQTADGIFRIKGLSRRRSRSPYRYPEVLRRSPRIATGSNAVVFEARDDFEARGPLEDVTINSSNLPLREANNTPPSQPVQKSNQPPVTLGKIPSPEPYIEDPHFVLGVGRGASGKEICDAYVQRIWEVEQGKIADGDATNRPDGPDLYDESIKYLTAARKMILGY